MPFRYFVTGIDMKQSRKVFLVFFILVCFGIISNNQMAYGSFEFHGEGQVIQITPGFENNPINVGDSFITNFFYPELPVDDDPNPIVGSYGHSEVSLRIGSNYHGDGDDCTVSVVDGTPLGAGDQVEISCSNIEIALGPVNGAVFESIVLTMTDFEGLVFDGDDLPINLEKIADSFETRIGILSYIAEVDGDSVPVFVVVEFEGAVDTDGDGIIDVWESTGFDKDLDGNIDIDFPGLGAKYDHKDIFVEIDYMINHEPSDNVINGVIASFALAPNSLVNNPDLDDGINLHIQVDEQITPHVFVLNMWSGFNPLKNNFFGTESERMDSVKIEAKKLFYRYGIFAHTINGEGISGQGEYPGNDFVVSLGDPKNQNQHRIGTERDESSVLMHELGHTLNLNHGGNDALNCKPNYLSVMNYPILWELLTPGNPLDYSRETNPNTLLETKLDENVGIPGPTNWMTLIGDSLGNADLVPVGVPLDFNSNDTVTDTGVSRNINKIGSLDCTGVGTTLSSYADWSNLLYDFRGTSAYFANGVHPDLMDEMTIDGLEDMLISTNPIFCDVPEDGNWIVTTSCNMGLNRTAPGNITIQNNSVLTIPENITLSILSGNNITIEFGSGVLIIKDGALQVNS